MTHLKIKTMHRVLFKSQGFTLLEVLFATAITAILLSAITLNLGVRKSLMDATSDKNPALQISSRLSEIVHSNTTAYLESLAGSDAKDNPLSDPEDTVNRKLISVELTEVGDSPTIAHVLAITISTNSSTITHWLTPNAANEI